jgi:hypothetical protein
MIATTILATEHETPLAPVTVVWSSRGRYWAVTVERCPLCGKRHHHGGGDGPACRDVGPTGPVICPHCHRVLKSGTHRGACPGWRRRQ